MGQSGAAISPRADKQNLALDLVLVVLLAVAVLGALRFNLIILHKDQAATPLFLSFWLAIYWPCLVLAVIERFRPSASPRKSAHSVLLHIQILLLFSAVGVVGGGALGIALEALTKALHIKSGWIDLRTPLSSTVAIVLGYLVFLLVFDFVQYWVHRLMHKSTVLWQNHKIHHMDPAFDALTAQRQNWTTIPIYFVLLQVPLSILFKFSNFDPVSLGVVNGTVISLLLALLYINHSSMRIQFGKASVLVVSTQTHRIHHSILPQHRDKNFASWFPIFDILFGTYYHPARDEFPPTGVEQEQEVRNLWEAQVLPLRAWWNMLRLGRVGRATHTGAPAAGFSSGRAVEGRDLV